MGMGSIAATIQSVFGVGSHALTQPAGETAVTITGRVARPEGCLAAPI